MFLLFCGLGGSRRLSCWRGWPLPAWGPWGHVQCQRPCRRSPPCPHCLLTGHKAELWEQFTATVALPEQPAFPPTPPGTHIPPCTPDVRVEVKSRAPAPRGFGPGLPPAGLGPTGFQTPSTARDPGRPGPRGPSWPQKASSAQRAPPAQLTGGPSCREHLQGSPCSVGGRCSGANSWATVPSVGCSCAEGVQTLLAGRFLHNEWGLPWKSRGSDSAPRQGAQVQTLVREPDFTRHSHVPQRRPCTAKSIHVPSRRTATIFVTNDKNLYLNKN